MSDSLQPHGLYSPWNSPGQNTGVGSLSLFQGIFPTQGSSSGFPHCRQILYQLSHKGSPRILEWVAYSFFSWSSQPRNQTGGLLHCRWILYQLSYQGSLLGGTYFISMYLTEFVLNLIRFTSLYSQMIRIQYYLYDNTSSNDVQIRT